MVAKATEKPGLKAKPRGKYNSYIDRQRAEIGPTIAPVNFS